MMPALRLAQAIRRRWFPPDAAPIHAARAVARWSLARAYPHGVPVEIGTAGVFRIDPTLTVGSIDFSRWGEGRNAGFASWIAACRDARVAFDIGAHIGLYTLPASRVLTPGGQLFAFEPGTANRAALDRHVAWNRCTNVTVVPCVVGAEMCHAVPFYEQPRDVVGMNSIVIRKDHARYRERAVEQVSIDAFCTANGILPDVVKIDVEGAELRVFRGARETFARARPTIVLSVHPEHLHLLGESADALMAYVRTLGYTVSTVNGALVEQFGAEEYICSPAPV